MAFADDMLTLRHEIDGLRARRMAMMRELNRFKSDLRKNTVRRRADMRKIFAKECSRDHAARRTFNCHTREMIEEMLEALSSERNAGRRNFLGKRA